MSQDNLRIAACSAVGALLGGVVGYLFLTESGRQARQQFGPAVEEVKRARQPRPFARRRRGHRPRRLEAAPGLCG